MKKIWTIAAIVVVVIYGVMCVRNEMKTNEYVSATAAYVDGAWKNGAITEKSCENLKRHLHYCWFYPLMVRKINADHVRELVDFAYQKQEKRGFIEDYVSFKMQ